MKKRSIELRQQRAKLLEELKPLAEKPSLSDEERAAWSEKRANLVKVENDLTTAVEQEEVLAMEAASRGETLSEQDKRDIRRYSLRKAILEASEGSLTGFELEMHQEGEREYKELGLQRQKGGKATFLMPSLLRYKPLIRASSGQSITTVADGGNLKQEEPLLFIEGLRNAMILPGLGARFLTGLVGDLPISIGGTFTASWLAEDGQSSTTKMSFGKKTLSPNRVQAQGSLTYQLLRQSSIDVDGIVEREVIDSIAQALQTAAINGSGENDEPTGILQTVGIGSVVGGDNGLAPAWSHIVGLETAVAEDNALFNPQYAAYLTNAKVRGKLKQVPQVNGTYGDRPIWMNGGSAGMGDVNGYVAAVTNAVPSTLTKGNASGTCSAIIFGVMNQLFIGQWGGYEIIVDPYTRSDYGEVKVTVIGHHDVGVGHPQSFAAMVDALTA